MDASYDAGARESRLPDINYLLHSLPNPARELEGTIPRTLGCASSLYPYSELHLTGSASGTQAGSYDHQAWTGLHDDIVDRSPIRPKDGEKPSRLLGSVRATCCHTDRERDCHCTGTYLHQPWKRGSKLNTRLRPRRRDLPSASVLSLPCVPNAIVLEDRPPQSSSHHSIRSTSTTERPGYLLLSKTQYRNDNFTSQGGSGRRPGTQCVDTALPDQCYFSAEMDPFQVSASLTQDYISAFAEYTALYFLEVLPRNPFGDWVSNGRYKSLEDRLVVYAAMALGTVYSTNPDRNIHRRVFKEILHSELGRHREGSNHLLVAHTLLLFALLNFIEVDYECCYQLLTRAVSYVANLHLNEEVSPPLGITVYELPAKAFSECRRRTFWMAFTIDVYVSTAGNHSQLLRTSDIHLKLPCTSPCYVTGHPPNAPVVNRVRRPSSTPNELGDYLLMVSVLSDVRLKIWRSFQPAQANLEQYRYSFARESGQTRLEAWSKISHNIFPAEHHGTPKLAVALDERARLRPVNLADTCSQLLYHYTWMIFSQRRDHRQLAFPEIVQHAKMANLHAMEVLRLAQQVVMRRDFEVIDCVRAARGPLGGCAAFVAVDVITAVGKVDDILVHHSPIMTLLYCALELLNALSSHWGTCETQRLLIARRIRTVFNAAQTALAQRKRFFYCTNSMVNSREQEHDLIYGWNRQKYLQAAYGLDQEPLDHEVFMVDTLTRV